MNPVEYTGHEKRITFQLYNYWFGLAGDHGIPPLTSLTPDDIGPYKNNMVLIDLRDPEEEPTLQVIGQLLHQDLDIDLTNKGISEIPRRTLLSRITDHYMEVLGNKSPISFDAEFKNKAREIILYRGILLPFSDDSENINFILGAVRWISEQEKYNNIEKSSNSPTEVESMDMVADEADVDITPPVTQQPEITKDDEFPAQVDIENEKSGIHSESTEVIEENTKTFSTLQAELEHCRALILGQTPSDNRSRKALYDALGAIYDFHNLCLSNPSPYQEILKAEGLKTQKRAPFTPTLKLCFGREYDKTRLTEYAAALSFAQKNNQTGDSLPDFLENFPGGIKGCVKAERDQRDQTASTISNMTDQEIHHIISEMPPLASFTISDPEAKTNQNNPDDIQLVLTKRTGQQMDVLKILTKDEKYLTTLLRRTVKDIDN